MSVVKINTIEAPDGAGPELEKRFSARAGAVENSPGFESFQLLRPTEGESRYFVVTQWESEDAFQSWLSSSDFAKGHANVGGADAAKAGGHPGAESGGGHPGAGHGGSGPVAGGASLLSFEVVEQIPAPGN